MEKKPGELVEAKSKKESLSKAYEQVHSQASSLLSFSLQWKDLEQRFDAIRESLECRSARLLESEKSLQVRVREVELREEALCMVQWKIEECKSELERKETELGLVTKRLEECRDEHIMKESQLIITRDALNDCLRLIREKEKELSCLMQSTEEWRRNYNSRMEQLERLQQEVDLTEIKLSSLQNLLQERSGQLDSKTERLHLVERSLAECSKDLTMKKDDLIMVQDSLEGCFKELESKENKFTLLQQSFQERTREVALKDRELQSLQSKIRYCCHEVQLKEKELGGIQKMVAERSNELECKETKLASISNELECKERKLVSIKTLMEEYSEELDSQEKQHTSIKQLIEEHAATLNLKQRESRLLEFSLQKLSEEVKFKGSELEVMVGHAFSYLTEIELKKKELASVQGMIEELNRTLERKNGEYKEIQKSIENLNLELELKERKMDFIQSSICECSKELDLKKKQLDSLYISVVANVERNRTHRRSSRRKQNILCSESSVGKDDSVSPAKRLRANGRGDAAETKKSHETIEGSCKDDNSPCPISEEGSHKVKGPLHKGSFVGKNAGNMGSKGRRVEAASANQDKDSKPNRTCGLDAERLKPQLVLCPDPEFSDFEKDKEQNCFAVNQIWACYDNLDHMPRYYARINKVFSQGFKLQFVWLEADPDNQDEIDWCDTELPVACGKYKNGDTDETTGHLIFSHQMQSTKDGRRGGCLIYPRKGEIWALFKNWDIKWSAEPEKYLPFTYDYVEVISNFVRDSGIKVVRLSKVKDFVCLFQRVDVHKDVDVSFEIPPHELYRFSHRIPSCMMTGKEREGVPAGSFELDPAAVDLSEPTSVEDVQMDGKMADTCFSHVESVIPRVSGYQNDSCEPETRRIALGLASRR